MHSLPRHLVRTNGNLRQLGHFNGYVLIFLKFVQKYNLGFKFHAVNDLSVGRIGPPFQCCNIRLIDSDEVNYCVEDEPYPRGEICIGGPNVAMGYLKEDDASQADFFEENGTRWFRTGDIGQLESDGSFRIIGEFFIRILELLFEISKIDFCS